MFRGIRLGVLGGAVRVNLDSCLLAAHDHVLPGRANNAIGVD